MDKLHGKLSHIQALSGSLSCVRTLVGSLATLNPYGDYTGETEITPSNHDQVVQTAGKAMRENILVKAIPQNYGLISWNGSVLTVS